ncbi:MAG: CBASS oligonucleotide cyclase [Actinomycetota bacterium]|nr:CBASS oligonucleotide cyclase [Actinomycetota bacterium]
MAATITASFTKLRQNLEITDLQASTVSTRQTNVRKAVEKDFTVLKSFLTGSYKRSTMIAPLKEADVDICVVLDASYFKSDGQASLLDKVRTTLLKTYPDTPKISRNGHAVTISFTDFKVDVVPAFNRKGGGFLIPDSSNRRWISTDPTIHETYMSESNSDHDGAVVPVVKMIKAWNREISRSFVPFYLELIAVEIFAGVTLSSDSSAIRYFFDKGRERIKTKVKDPAGLGEQIDPLFATKTVSDAVNRFQVAYDRAIKAEQFAKNDNTSAAIVEWRKVFGGYFPAYG